MHWGGGGLDKVQALSWGQIIHNLVAGKKVGLYFFGNEKPLEGVKQENDLIKFVFWTTWRWVEQGQAKRRKCQAWKLQQGSKHETVNDLDKGCGTGDRETYIYSEYIWEISQGLTDPSLPEDFP
jgi:hypothetical protein